MQDLLMNIANLSLSGSIVILVVLFIRFLLKGSPKKYAYSLWSVVLFRLLCPVTFTANFSVVSWVRSWFLPENRISGSYTIPIRNAAADGPTVAFQTAPAAPAGSTGQAAAALQTRVSRVDILALFWLAGVLILVIVGLVQYIRLRRSLTEAVRRTENVYLADHISTPFVMGLFRPRIYLPSGLPREEQRFILAHERQHIRRMDHLWKFLGYAALCLHLFNPLVWLAFFLAGKDMEMSCDEAVISAMGPEIRADYAQALLQLATHKLRIAGMPLAFGEGDTKTRVKNLAKWRRPKVWVSILCVVVCIVAVLLCSFNSKAEPPEATLDGPTSVGIIGELNFELPEGCSFRGDMQALYGDGGKTADFSLLADGQEIGGVKVFPLPEEQTEFLWEKLPLPEWRDESLGYYGENETLEFFSDVPPGQERTLHRLHHFYVYEDQIYDLWFDLLTASEQIQKQILDSVSLGDSGWKTSGLPSWVREEGGDGVQSYYKGDALAAQLVTYAIPDGVYDPFDTTFEWLDKMDIPDLHDPDLYFSGGITTWNGGWKATYESLPEAEKEVKRTHRFYPSGQWLYDLWFDETVLSIQEEFELEDAFTFYRPEGERTELSAEDAAFAKCREITQYVIEQDVAVHSVLTYDNHPEKNVTQDYWIIEEDDISMLQTIAAQSGTTAKLYCHDRDFVGTDTGNGMQWIEVEGGEYNGPWLGINFIRKYMTYVDTQETDEGTCFMFRSEAPLYLEGEKLSDIYFPSFYFDPDGNFLRVEIQGAGETVLVERKLESGDKESENLVGQILGTASFTLVESIVTTDSAKISGEIEKAFQEAIK